jgi:hypothetical protein
MFIYTPNKITDGGERYLDFAGDTNVRTNARDSITTQADSAKPHTAAGTIAAEPTADSTDGNVI